MRRSEIRRRCEAITNALEIPDPFDVHRLCQAVAASRGRPIVLRPMAMPPDSPSGLWIATDKGDYIFFEGDTTQLHQEHIVLHELAHLLMGHGDGTVERIAEELFPDLDSQLVQRVVKRSAYPEAEEVMAERVATQILAKANRWRPVSEWQGPADAADVRYRIERTVETP